MRRGGSPSQPLRSAWSSACELGGVLGGGSCARSGAGARGEVRPSESLLAYPAIVSDVRDLLERPQLRGATAALVVDATGVGAAVVGLFEDAGLGVRLVPITITAGSEAQSRAGGGAADS